MLHLRGAVPKTSRGSRHDKPTLSARRPALAGPPGLGAILSPRQLEPHPCQLHSPRQSPFVLSLSPSPLFFQGGLRPPLPQAPRLPLQALPPLRLPPPGQQLCRLHRLFRRPARHDPPTRGWREAHHGCQATDCRGRGWEGSEGAERRDADGGSRAAAGGGVWWGCEGSREGPGVREVGGRRRRRRRKRRSRRTARGCRCGGLPPRPSSPVCRPATGLASASFATATRWRWLPARKAWERPQ